MTVSQTSSYSRQGKDARRRNVMVRLAADFDSGPKRTRAAQREKKGLLGQLPGPKASTTNWLSRNSGGTSMKKRLGTLHPYGSPSSYGETFNLSPMRSVGTGGGASLSAVLALDQRAARAWWSDRDGRGPVTTLDFQPRRGGGAGLGQLYVFDGNNGKPIRGDRLPDRPSHRHRPSSDDTCVARDRFRQRQGASISTRCRSIFRIHDGTDAAPARASTR